MMSPAEKARLLRRIRLVALPALVVLIGSQTLRIFVPSVAWYLSESLNQDIDALTLIALGTVLTGLLSPIVRRAIGARTAIWITAGGMAVIRFAIQLTRQPGLDMWLSTIGTSLFVICLPILVGHLRTQNSRLAGPRIAYGLILGLALDTGIRGATWSLDLVWIPGPVAISIAGIICGLLLWILSMEFRGQERTPVEANWRNAAVALGLGPMLFLQAIIFQNQGWISTVAAAPPSVAFLLVMLGNVLAAVGAAFAFARPRSFHPAVGLLAASIFISVIYFQSDSPGVMLPLGGLNQFFWGWGLALIATMIAPAQCDGLIHTTWTLVGGLVLFIMFAFLYYARLAISIPLPWQAFLASAAAVSGAALTAATLRVRSVNVISRNELPMTLPVLLLLTLPVIQILAQLGQAPSTSFAPGPITVMTYNIHSAFDPSGWQDPEAIAQIIEENDVQIVGLQEVSRGWLVNGSTDLAGWLSHRLGMRMFFVGTAGPLWGNALLTRLAMLGHGARRLPNDGAVLERGFLWARLARPEDEALQVIVTHLHHIESDQTIRLHQLATIIDWWDGRPNTILLGDLNAEPASEEIRTLLDAGLKDAWEMGGKGDGYTSPADQPHERIDWIWISPDLTATDAFVTRRVASDHLAVGATLGK